MANPFLMDEELEGTNDDTMNPFLMQSNDDVVTDDNPFANDTSNPFSIGDEIEVHTGEEYDAVMSFFGTTIEAEDDSVSVKSIADEDEQMKKGPPIRPVPPKTQELINTVSNQLDETSSDLLGRIPVTRPPSPVSIRDLQTPSPTQENSLLDLLDMSESGSVTNAEEFRADLIEAGKSTKDNPFSISDEVTSSHENNTVVELKQPPRPPPPKPAPPRPAPPTIGSHKPPPRPLPPPQAVTNNVQSEDLFDMFGTTKPPKPPPPKTKEDILSLFDKPVQPVSKPDLLTDDIVLDSTKTSESEEEMKKSEHKQEDAIFTSVLIRPDETTHNITSEPPSANKYVNGEQGDVQEQVNNKPRAPTPDIEITTVESLPRSDDEEDLELKNDANAEIEDNASSNVPSVIIQTEPSPPPDEETVSFETTGEQLDHSSPSDSAVNAHESPITNEEDLYDVTNADSADVDSKPTLEKMDTGFDFAPASGASSVNPFASPDEEEETYPPSDVVTNIFAADETTDSIPDEIYTAPAETHIAAFSTTNIFKEEPDTVPERVVQQQRTNIFAEPDEFDAFAAKFESVKKDNISILDGFGGSGAVTPTLDAWGDSAFGTPNRTGDVGEGFGNDDDDFYSMKAPIRADSVESVERDFNVVIRPKTEGAVTVAPQLAPPPQSRMHDSDGNRNDLSPVINPFEDSGFQVPESGTEPSLKRTDSQETPQTPLFDEDVSQPLEDFPRLNYEGPGWEMQLRQPNKKKITGQRFWKKIFIRLVIQNDVPVVQLLNQASDKQAFQELPLQPSYSVSEIGAQQYDQFGKIFTMKLQYIFYKERPGVRPGQVTKAERITNKLTKFAQYAIAGDYEGVKEFGSDLKKLGLPVEHAPQSSQLFKIGSMNYEDLKQFSVCIEEALFGLSALRERALTYKMEEVQITAVDEIVVEQDAEGKILKQIARVRLFFLAFLTGMPTIELGINDMWRQGKEVVGRHDIIPVATEEWIRLEVVEFHSVVNQEEYENSRLIKFQPPDANYIELLRFRVRPPKNRELPLQLKATWIVTGNKVELRADILVPGFTSRKLGQIPCEDVSVRFPIPECWIYLFRVEKHFRYGSVKSAHRRTGKIKGIERILGTVDTLQESLIEVTSGQAKYEHHHRAIVWRCPRLPKEGQGAYTTHQLVCRMALTSYDQIPNELAPYAYVEFTMPATQVSHTTVRSVSVQDSDSDDPPEKYVRYLARHEYKVGIETTHGETTSAYLAATRPLPEEPAAKPPASPVPPSDSDSDSN